MKQEKFYQKNNMILIIKALITGLVVGLLFAVLKLPIPAPPTLAGIMGIIGVFLGFIIVNSF